MTLPIGWARSTISAFADTKLGKMLDAAKNKGESVPYLRNINVRWGAFDLSDLLEMRASPTELSDLEIRNGDIFICEGGEPGRCAVWHQGKRKLIFQKALHRVRVLDEIQPDYVANYIRHFAVKHKFSEFLTGTTIKHLPQVALQRIAVELPPAAEQRRIVAKLDALFARLARARAELDRVPTLADRIREAVLGQAYSGALTGVTPNHRACEYWINSTFYGPRFGKEQYVEDGVPTIRTTDFRENGTIRLDDAPRVDCAESDLAKWGLENGDLLVTRTGSIGKCAVYTSNSGYALPSAYLIRVRFNEQILPRFAWMMFASPQGQAHLTGSSRAVTQPNINASMIRSLPFPDLDLKQQAEIVSWVDGQAAHADRLEAEAARARALLDRLEAAILTKAFKGELVPQDPNDEPASVLLERIRAQRAAAATEPRQPRGRRAVASRSAKA